MTETIAVKAFTYSDAFRSTNNNVAKEGILTETEEIKIAKIVNNAINIPFMRESREQAVFEAGIRLVDKAISKHLPEDLLKFVHDVKNGLSNEEVATLEERLAPIINRMINIPLVPEFLEQRLISLVLGIIFNAMRKGSDILSDG